MTHALTISLAVLGGLAAPVAAPPPSRLVIITFDKSETGKPMPSYTDRGVVFAPAHKPTRSKAAGKVMFFPHLKTPRRGILNAMATESIPVEARFPKPVSCVTLVLWGSIGSAAVVEAYDKDDKVVDRASRDKVPERAGPEQPVPSFELTVKSSAIAYVRFSGAPPGGYLVCDEVRFLPPRGEPWDVPPLKEAFKGKFLIGAALDVRRVQSQAPMEGPAPGLRPANSPRRPVSLRRPASTACAGAAKAACSPPRP